MKQKQSSVPAGKRRAKNRTATSPAALSDTAQIEKRLAAALAQAREKRLATRALERVLPVLVHDRASGATYRELHEACQAAGIPISLSSLYRRMLRYEQQLGGKSKRPSSSSSTQPTKGPRRGR